MATYLISYDNHPPRDYRGVYTLMAQWGAKRLLESLWLANLVGPAATVRDLVRNSLGPNDGVAVIEITSAADWAIIGCQTAGFNFLKLERA